MKLLVDSTVYIDLLRARKDPVEALRPWLGRDEVVSCGAVRCEVLRGIMSRKVRERMRSLFDVLLTVRTDEALWDRVAELAWTLDRRDLVLPLSVLVIASCAARAKAAVVTTDRHFRSVPDLQVLRDLPDR